jgi:hypothetical protein
MRSISRVCLIAVLTVICGYTMAHQISPLQSKYKPRQSPSIWQRISEPVHEEITLRARLCAQSAQDPIGSALICSSTDPKPVINVIGNKYDSLIRGVWWNDDPNQLLFALRQAKWFAWMKDGAKIAKHGRNLRGAEKKLNQTYYLNYRGHFGDLQFLHGMASADGESAEQTQENILEWAEFSYAVATKKIMPETMLADVRTTGFQNHFANQPGWTVSYLFGPRYRLKGDHYSSMALGSLLHVIQDSFSEAHTFRDFGASPNCPNGRVTQFYSYVNQDPNLHNTEDTRTAWMSRKFNSAQDPVSASATLIRFAEQDTEWSIVRAYLLTNVFCIDSDAVPAGPGRFISGGH